MSCITIGRLVDSPYSITCRWFTSGQHQLTRILLILALLRRCKLFVERCHFFARLKSSRLKTQQSNTSLVWDLLVANLFQLRINLEHNFVSNHTFSGCLHQLEVQKWTARGRLKCIKRSSEFMQTFTSSWIHWLSLFSEESACAVLNETPKLYCLNPQTPSLKILPLRTSFATS